MKSNLVLILFIIPLLSSCLTVSKFTRIMEDNPNISPSETIKKLGTAKEINTLPNNTMYMIYSTPWADKNQVVYFKDNKLIGYGEDNKYFHLNMAYQVGLIDKDEYRWQYEMFKQEEIANYQNKLALFGLIQNRQYQRKSLNNQKEMIDLQKQPTYHSGAIYDYKTGRTYNYQGVERK